MFLIREDGFKYFDKVVNCVIVGNVKIGDKIYKNNRLEGEIVFFDHDSNVAIIVTKKQIHPGSYETKVKNHNFELYRN
jgi:hypothetical protein